MYIETARSQACLDDFLTRYADLATNSLSGSYVVWLWGTEEYVSTGNLAATLAYGLADSSCSFTLYLRGRAASHNHVMVHFGGTTQLLLGLSVEESIWGISNTPAAERILAQLKAEFDVQKGLVAFELPPVDAAAQLSNS
ncbi:hypothetical protein [Hymenobacter arcticus]